ncbi:hypothetical protein BDN72DRAFT_745039, partial [Pluteus cervinus]
RELQDLAGDLEQAQNKRATNGDEDKDDGDNLDGWVDELDELSPEELVKILREVGPTKCLLAKLRTYAYKIVNSSTILLPAWYAILAELGLDRKLLPRDVRTRWNSTYDLLVVAIKYRKAVDKMTSDK